MFLWEVVLQDRRQGDESHCAVEGIPVDKNLQPKKSLFTLFWTFHFSQFRLDKNINVKNLEWTCLTSYISKHRKNWILNGIFGQYTALFKLQISNHIMLCMSLILIVIQKVNLLNPTVCLFKLLVVWDWH